MVGNILVSLQRGERIEEIVPYIEKIAQPGMRVIFLIRYPVDGFRRLNDYLLNMETGIRPALEGQKATEMYSLQGQRRLAGERLRRASEALQKLGVEIAIDVYAGSLKRVVKSYSRNGDVHLVMMPASRVPGILRVFTSNLGFRGLFKKPAFPPVLLHRLD